MTKSLELWRPRRPSLVEDFLRRIDPQKFVVERRKARDGGTVTTVISRERRRENIDLPYPGRRHDD